MDRCVVGGASSGQSYGMTTSAHTGSARIGPGSRKEVGLATWILAAVTGLATTIAALRIAPDRTRKDPNNSAKRG
jgi:hypothetical protein